jgi:PAS domain S-box-containing protein
LEAMLNTLPVDITFVDKDNIVKYFSHGAERIFPRTKSVIGRSVENCHPPASVHVVEKVVEDLRSGKKDHEDFWIKMGEKYVLIRYFAVRGADGEYLGTLEFSQNIKPLQEITGEKRLLDE